MIDYTIIQYLNQHSKTGKFRKRDVVARYPTKYLNKRRVLEPGPGVIDDIFNQYDFIGLVELAGESLAVLINVLELEIKDVVFGAIKPRTVLSAELFRAYGNAKAVLDFIKKGGTEHRAAAMISSLEYGESSLNLTMKPIPHFGYRIQYL
eukprot:CAMPEP_0204892840 /NCGR_PEP_ID=MMETSP1349-20130617/30128_1 /ASSEMBLY_ACC=CAM_ASM_000710 /TAXON_ID=215587 /ORGANISM="Aplanochytrium stocchinoi, Strain GSBS06" /LENGTH=149 /DNA_ID=CAMNT_0052059033 /DNA_START=47 /DNA_END=497 /DNA_ORIENTATION=-